MKVGELVQYCIPSGGRIPVGVIIAIEPIMNPRLPYRVRWSDHTGSERDWYGPRELVRLCKLAI